MTTLSRSTRLLLTSALAGSFFLLFIHFTNPMVEYHSPREIDTFVIAQGFYEKGLSFWRPYLEIFDTYFALELQLYTYLVSKVFALAGGSSVLIARSVSIAASTFSVLLFGLIVNRMYRNGAVTLLATTLFAYIPLRIYFGRAVQPDTFMVFLGLLGLWCMLKFKEKRNPLLAGLAFMGAALATLIKPSSIIFLVAVGWIYADNFSWFKKPYNLGRFAKWFLVMLLACIPIFAYYFFVADSAGIIKGNLAYPRIYQLYRGMRSFFFEIHPLLLLLFAWSLFLKYRDRDSFLLPTLAASSAYVLLNIAVWLGGAHEHHVLPVVPFLCIHAAKVLAESGRLQRWFSRSGTLIGVLAATIALSLFGSWILFRRTVKYAPVYLRQSEIIRQYTEPDSIVVTDDPQYNHYLFFSRRRGYLIPAPPRDPVRWNQETLIDLIRKSAQYLVISDYKTLSPGQQNILAAHQLLHQEVTQFGEEFRIYKLSGF